jgi:hypothetical protein
MLSEKTNNRLFTCLLESIKHKSVYTTLKNVLSGKKTSTYYTLKGLFSLATHISIELEHNKLEYLPLLKEVNEKIQKILKTL